MSSAASVDRTSPRSGKVLVTGGTGFVGPKIVRALRGDEQPVRCLVRDRRKALQLETWGCELVEGDITDAGSLRRSVAGCDAVVHLVAIIVGGPREFDRVMSQATRDLVAAAEAEGVRRFVLMSALGTSERSKDLVPYYRSKWEMEAVVKSSGLDYVILRPSFVFGRGGGVLPMFVRQVRLSPIVPIVGDGTRRLQPIWVGDVATFFAGAVRLPTAAKRTFELGGPDAVTWNELYATIARVLGKRRAALHLPFGVVRVAAALAERLPRPPITRDQLTMLSFEDSVCDPAPAIETFGVHPIGLEEQLRRVM